MLALPAMNGCLWHTRRVPVAKMPSTVLTATPEQLVNFINQQYDAVSSLSATVTFTATSGGSLSGKEKTIAPFSGYILLRKPESLRVIGYLPVVHSPAFDMASNGNTFTLVIPPKNKAIEGTNALTQPSPNALENMRPFMFFNAMLIPRIEPQDKLIMTADSDVEVNPKTKKLEIRPEYLLTVARPQGDSNVFLAERVIQFSRIDLRPVEEDIYDRNGQIQTQAMYGALQTFGTEHFPGTVTIRWPQQQEQILMTVEKLRVNLPLNDQTFELKIPEGTPVQKLP
jgi:outer membrane lipoprotein-sorting protein